MPLVLTNRRRRGGSASAPVFSPSTLFALAEPGVWYDPSDLTTLFTDTAGTTPVTTPGNTVALMLDKSKGGVGTNGAARRNQFLWTQDFRDTAAAGETRPWTYTNATVAATSTLAPDGTSTAQKISETSGSGKHRSYQVFGLNSTTYTFTCYMKAAERSWAYLNFGDIIDRQTWFNLATGAVGTVGAGITASIAETPAGSGWYRCSVSKTTVSANPNFDVGIATADGTFSYTGVTGSGILIWGAQLELGSTASAYQRITSDWPSTMTGNHATQATAASRPTFGVVPLGGRRNQFLQTEDFSNAAWTKTTTSPVTTLTNQGGGVWRLQAAAGTWSILQSIPAAGTHVISFDVKSNGAGLDNFSLMLGGTFVGGNRTATSDWVRYSSSGLNGGSGFAGIVRTTTNDAVDILIRFPQLEIAATATNYQKVTTAFDVTEAGVQSLSYLSFDGVDDGMVTGTITPGVDKAQVFAGVRKLSGETIGGTILEFSASIGNAGTLGVFSGSLSGSSTSYGFYLNGTSATGQLATPFTSPTTNVLSVMYNIAEATRDLEVKPRVNGQVPSLAGQISASAGTGNFLAHPLYVGRRGGVSEPFSGQIYSLITRFGANLASTTINSTEYWVGDKTGINIANNISTTIFARDDTAVLDRANSIIERRA